MPDSTRVLTALRNELVTAGLVRRPATAGALPPAFVEPEGGAPAPKEREAPETDGELVVTLRLSGELGEAPFDAYRRRVVIDVIYRSSSNLGLITGRGLDAAIRRRLVERADYGIGYTLDAAGTHPTQVLQAGIFGGLGPVSDVAGVRTELAKYALEVLAA